MENKFAVIQSGSHQYLVQEGEVLKLQKISQKEGEEFEFTEVLLVVNGSLKLGAPFVKRAKVTAQVLKEGRDKKIIVFRYHSKNRYKKKKGHRQHFTQVKILSIQAN